MISIVAPGVSLGMNLQEVVGFGAGNLWFAKQPLAAVWRDLLDVAEVMRSWFGGSLSV